MDRRTLLALAAVFVFLAGSAAVLIRRGARPTEEAMLWPGGDAAKVQALTIASSTGTVSLSLKGGAWQLESPLSYPANASVVQPLVEKLPKTALSGPLTESKDRQAMFGFAPGIGLHVSVKGPAGLEFEAGKPGPDFDSLYVKRAGSDAVYEAKGLSLSDLERPATEWVSKAVLAVPVDGLDRVVLKSSFTVAMVRSSGAWTLEGKDTHVSAAPGSPLNGIQGMLHDFQADQVALPPLPPLPAKPLLEVRAAWAEKGGARQDATLLVYPEKSGMMPVVKKGEDRVRFLVYPWRLDNFRKPASEYR